MLNSKRTTIGYTVHTRQTTVYSGELLNNLAVVNLPDAKGPFFKKFWHIRWSRSQCLCMLPGDFATSMEGNTFTLGYYSTLPVAGYGPGFHWLFTYDCEHESLVQKGTLSINS